MSSSRSLAKLATRVVDEASDVLRELFNENYLRRRIGRGFSGDTSLEADLYVEKLIVERLRSSSFKIMIVSEERGLVSVDNPDYIALIDPLDGSLNFYVKVPFIAVSIVFYDYSKPYTDEAIAGAVSNVFLGETYSFDEEYVYVNDKPIDIVEKDVKGVFSIYTEEPYLISRVKDILEKTTGIQFKVRTLGSAALESTYSVLGLIDLFVHNTGKLRNLDVAFALAISKRLNYEACNLSSGEVRLRTDRVENVESIVLGKMSNVVIRGLRSNCRG